MKTMLIAIVANLCLRASAQAESPVRIAIIDSQTPTQALLARPGTYLGETFTFEDNHPHDVTVRVGVWESGKGKLLLDDFPFTEYVLMISGRVLVTEIDGTQLNFVTGDTFVIPKGWSGTWDVQERMKKQIVRIGRFD